MSQRGDRIDALVIGAGVVGAAIAHRLASRGLQCWLLDKHTRPGGETTERNSGVIHAGLYYPKETLKTKTCIAGNPLIYEWAERFNIAHRRCGKLIVACTEEDEHLLEARYRHAKTVGVSGLRRVSQKNLRSQLDLPQIKSALFSENTGIVDPVELTRSLIARSPGLELVLNAEVTQIDCQTSDTYRVQTTRGPIDTGLLVNAAGLFADRVAKMIGVDDYRIYPCRGDYFWWRTKRRFEHLIYPVKSKNAPGLGVHLTLDLNGGIKWGPDAEYLDGDLDYGPAEYKRDRFVEAVRRIFPDVQPEELVYDSCGIRPKLRGPTENEERDFIVSEDRRGFINLVGIESPGLTASLALADLVAEKLGV